MIHCRTQPVYYYTGSTISLSLTWPYSRVRLPDPRTSCTIRWPKSPGTDSNCRRSERRSPLSKTAGWPGRCGYWPPVPACPAIWRNPGIYWSNQVHLRHRRRKFRLTRKSCLYGMQGAEYFYRQVHENNWICANYYARVLALFENFQIHKWARYDQNTIFIYT